MIIISILVSPLVIGFARSRMTNHPFDVKKYACWGLGGAFVFFFIGHLAQTEGMVAMLPPWVPYRLTLVYLTGMLELVVAIGLFVPQWQARAAAAAIAMLVVFFPANVYSAFNHVGLGGHQWGPVYLWIRTPLQLIIIGWAYFLCMRRQSSATDRQQLGLNT
tara:strand:- start:11814 stop:12299 length:486 start_codon:yes stop_codon:yes gene_type:complete